jgi:hypothetical protein
MQRELIAGAALIVAAQAALIFTMLVGTALEDPGGATGVAIVVAPVLVTAVLGAVAWWRPRAGAFVAVAAGIAAVAAEFSGARVTDIPDWFVAFAHVIAVGAFVIIGAYAMRRPVLGGGLLLVVAALVGLATPEIALFLAGPPALAGVLFLGASRLEAGHHAPQVGPVG